MEVKSDQMERRVDMSRRVFELIVEFGDILATDLLKFDDEGMTEEEVENYVREEAWEYRDRIANGVEPDWEEITHGG